MGVISIPFNDPDSLATGMLHLENGPWVGSSKILRFTDTIYGNEGNILCDCRESTPRIRLDQTFSPMGGVDELSKVVSTMLRPFHHGQFHHNLFETIRDLYTKDYCLECLDPLMEPGLDAEDKTVARQVVERVGTGRILVAGCGRGQGLLELRRMGIDAWGVDITPDLDEVVLPEAREYVRRGSVHDLPFDDEDRFDTLLCLGVLEHLPEDLVEAVAEEANRLRVKHLVTMIDHDDFNRPGHLTLRPLSWWATRLASRFTPIRSAFPLPTLQPIVPWGPDFQQRLRLWTNHSQGFGEEELKRKAEEIPVGSGVGSGSDSWSGSEGDTWDGGGELLS